MKLLLLTTLFCLTFTQQVTIAIIGTNDIHGSAFPTTLMRSDTKETYKYGGLAYMGGLIDIIKKENPDHVMYVDAGDQFQGGIESSALISGGQIMNDFFNIMQVNGSAIGNHQFDFGPDFLFPYLQGRSSENLALNLRSEEGKQNFLYNQKTSKILELADDIKIGLIGLATVETPTTTTGFIDHLFPDYEFLQYRNLVLEEATKLRKHGVNAVLLVGHVGDACVSDAEYGLWTEKNAHGEDCPEDEISTLIDALPSGTINGIIQGHRHKFAHNFKKGIPSMGVINGGYYFNVLYLTFNSEKQIVNSMIEGPIPVCEKVFENLGTCHYLAEEEVSSAGELVDWYFHSQKVVIHEQIQKVFDEKYLPKMQPYLVDIVANQIEMGKQKMKESEMGNLLTNIFSTLYCNGTQPDITIVNPGIFRTTWFPMVLQYQHLYNMFPFNNHVECFSINGEELYQTLKIAQSGVKGFYPTSGLNITANLYGDGRKEFVSAVLADGSEIDRSKEYLAISVDFLLNGGDDFKNIIDIVYTPRNIIDLGDLKTLVEPKLQRMGIIRKGTLIDPQHPRLTVINK